MTQVIKTDNKRHVGVKDRQGDNIADWEKGLNFLLDQASTSVSYSKSVVTYSHIGAQILSDCGLIEALKGGNILALGAYLRLPKELEQALLGYKSLRSGGKRSNQFTVHFERDGGVLNEIFQEIDAQKHKPSKPIKISTSQLVRITAWVGALDGWLQGQGKQKAIKG